eukprot:EC823966.1.p1 GENE.EC823966.1~~EC823966.1.p1  ORF type:complete len:215 (+),score=37.85 EC823966.1:30-647(+)
MNKIIFILFITLIISLNIASGGGMVVIKTARQEISARFFAYFQFFNDLLLVSGQGQASKQLVEGDVVTYYMQARPWPEVNGKPLFVTFCTTFSASRQISINSTDFAVVFDGFHEYDGSDGKPFDETRVNEQGYLLTSYHPFGFQSLFVNEYEFSISSVTVGTLDASSTYAKNYNITMSSKNGIIKILCVAVGVAVNWEDKFVFGS